MPNLQKVIKVTQSQYNTLANGGTVGEYTGLDNKYIYLIVDTNNYVVADSSGNVSINGSLEVTGDVSVSDGVVKVNSDNSSTYTGDDWDTSIYADKVEIYNNNNSTTGTLQFPDVGSSTKTLATTDQIPADSNLVHKTGGETIGGSKVFNDVIFAAGGITVSPGATTGYPIYINDGGNSGNIIEYSSGGGVALIEAKNVPVGSTTSSTLEFILSGNPSTSIPTATITMAHKTGTIALTSDIPSVPTNVSAFTNDAGYITKSVNDLTNYTLTSELATVATSGSYNDLSNKPTIPAAQVQTDWNATSGMGVLLNKPTLATVATSGSYNDLSNKPTIPTSIEGMSGGSLTSPLTMYGGDSATASKLILDASRSGQVTDQSNATLFGFLSNNATTFTVGGNSYALNLRGNQTRPKYKGSDLALYSDVPAAQVNSDWNATSGVAQILNKPSIPSSTGDLTNDRFVRYDTASQGLTDTQKSNARTNIGAGTSNFTGYTSSNKLSTDYINNVAGWTSNAGTITGVSVGGTSVATSGVANITSIPYSILTGAPTVPTQAADVNDYGQKYVNPSQVRDYQTIFGIAPTLLTNINGHSLSSIYNTEDVTIDGYPAVKIRNNDGNTNLTFDQSHNYMRKITGSNFTPIFDDGTVPQYSYIVGGDGTIYKPQWDSTNGLLLYKVNRLAMYSNIPSTYLKSASASGNTLTLTKQDDTTVTFTPSFSESDTLGTVTSRGASTTTPITLGTATGYQYASTITSYGNISGGYSSYTHDTPSIKDFGSIIFTRRNSQATGLNSYSVTLQSPVATASRTINLPDVSGDVFVGSVNPSSTTGTLTGLTINGTSYAIAAGGSIEILDLR